MLQTKPLAQGWDNVEDAKTDTKLAITWYKNNHMQANATKFHYMPTCMDTDTDVQCEDINIISEDLVNMLGLENCNLPVMFDKWLENVYTNWML